MKVTTRIIISLITILFSFAAGSKSDALLPPYDQQQSSSPVLVNGLEFVANVQTQWYAPVAPVIELSITNRTSKPILFPTLDTFGLKIKSEDGTIVVEDLGRHITCLTPPVLVLPGTRYSLIREATLSVDNPAIVDKPIRLTRFLYLDGTGTNIGNRIPLKKAKYFLTFWFSNAPSGSELEFADTRKMLEKSVIWTGQGTTPDVPFELLDPLPGS